MNKSYLIKMDFYLNPQSSPPFINSFYDTECDIEKDFDSNEAWQKLCRLDREHNYSRNVFSVSCKRNYVLATNVDKITHRIRRIGDLVYDNYFYLTFDGDVPQNKKELLNCVEVRGSSIFY